MVHMMVGTFEQLYAKIAPQRIHFLRFILEGYDGLAVLSTINAETGVVLIRFPHEARRDIISLLEDMTESLTQHNQPNKQL